MRALALVCALMLGASAAGYEYPAAAASMTPHSSATSCVAKFNPPPIALVPRASPSVALLTSCPLNGLSNQLLALLAAAAIAGDLGIPFWIPRLVVDNLSEPPNGATVAQHGAFCSSCMRRVLLAGGGDIAEILNTSLLESVGGVRLDTDALLSKAFRRSRTVLDVCRAQRREFPFAFSNEACAESPAAFAMKKAGGVKRPHRSFHLTGTTGAAIYACVKTAVRAVLANASTSGEALWIKFGATVHDYYRLCPRPPASAPPFFRFNADVYSTSARVFGRLAAGFPRLYEPDPRLRACAHIRLSMPGEGWDQMGSPFTETAVSQIRSLRPWLKRAIEQHIPTLILTDAPWLLQRTVEEVGIKRSLGCYGKGKCAFGDDLLDQILEGRLGHGVEVSMHFRTASMQLACATADRLLLTPKSSYSKMIKMLALQRAADERRVPPAITYTNAKVRFAANVDNLPFLRFARGCVGLRRVSTPEIIGASVGGSVVDGAGVDDEPDDDDDAKTVDAAAAGDEHESKRLDTDDQADLSRPPAVGPPDGGGGATSQQSALQTNHGAGAFFFDELADEEAPAAALDDDEPRKRCIAVRVNQLLLAD